MKWDRRSCIVIDQFNQFKQFEPRISNPALHFPVKIDMSWSVDQIEQIFRSLHRVSHRCRHRLDRDPSFPLHVQRVKRLFPVDQCPTVLQYAVGKRTFPMINVGNYRKISDSIRFKVPAIRFASISDTRGRSCRKFPCALSKPSKHFLSAKYIKLN